MSASLSPPRVSVPSSAATERDVPRAAIVVAVVAAAISWVPMALLALAERTATGDLEPLRIFARDVATHVRLLFAVPVLIVGDALIERAIVRCEDHLSRSGLVDTRERRLAVAVAVSRKLRRSRAVLAAFVVAVVVAVVTRRLDEVGSVFSSRPGAEAGAWAGAWLTFVARPLLLLLMLRWLFRWLVWSGFLARVARLELRVVAPHPDCAGGLGFLTGPTNAAVGIVAAVTAVASVEWRLEVLSHATTVAQLRGSVLVLAGILLGLLLAPLVVFTPRLLRLRRVGIVEYSRLGQRYARAFRDKWLREGGTSEDPLGSNDISALADLAGGMAVVRGLRPTPIDTAVVLHLAVAFALAMLPLLLAEVPLDELLGRVAQTLL